MIRRAPKSVLAFTLLAFLVGSFLAYRHDSQFTAEPLTATVVKSEPREKTCPLGLCFTHYTTTYSVDGQEASFLTASPQPEGDLRILYRVTSSRDAELAYFRESSTDGFGQLMADLLVGMLAAAIALPVGMGAHKLRVKQAPTKRAGRRERV